MQLDDLKRYGIPGPLLAAWRERQGDLLLPLQSAAVLGGLLSDRRDTLIAGPTSSGKSFCGELALARSLIERRKGAFVVPLKSIAEEKFAALEPICKKLKLRAVIATADHPGSDSLLESGRFDIAVCVYEKFNRLLLANIDMLATFNVVVIDELQLVSDPGRGRVLESLLIKMRGFAARAGSAPRLVALSAASGSLASSGSDDELAAWLNLRLIRETTRPRDLRQGVIYNEEYIYRSFNTGLIGREPFQLGGSESASGADDSASGVDDKTSGNRLTDRLLGVLRRAPGQKL
ncbi:MAG: DEAD/DEAH box helicase, partial [candidate division Zixibacteria bacterium]|nr:DEAD/DEAH box helicase [candidate division Zixibacteria bacterium]